MIREVEKRDGAIINRGYREVLSPIESKGSKMHKRFLVEHKNDEVANYDIYDMYADLANAFNDLLDGKSDTPAIKKYQTRQAKVLEALKA